MINLKYDGLEEDLVAMDKVMDIHVIELGGTWCSQWGFWLWADSWGNISKHIYICNIPYFEQG